MGVLSLLGAGTMALLAPGPGICGAVAAAAAFFGYQSMAKKQFGGVTGDTSGFFIQLCELCVLLGAWIGGYL
jgi:adenosylcobinamide-GDP ribazoletransferase